LRETKEETGLTLTKYKYRGIVTFISDIYETEYMHLFTASGFTGNISECDEGVLEWIDKKVLYDLTLWEGDKIFLDLISKECPFFSLKLEYQGDNLIYAALDGKEIIKR
jgi:8-oxo-dGTP diphosphatase